MLADLVPLHRVPTEVESVRIPEVLTNVVVSAVYSHLTSVRGVICHDLLAGLHASSTATETPSFVVEDYAQGNQRDGWGRGRLFLVQRKPAWVRLCC